ncbi:MAG: Trm112 family protein [Candidatus Aenigmatarchaeota archaeon]
MVKNALDVLACPKCKGNLQSSGSHLMCKRCKMLYSIIDGIPDMLIEDAKKI